MASRSRARTDSADTSPLGRLSRVYTMRSHQGILLTHLQDRHLNCALKCVLQKVKKSMRSNPASTEVRGEGKRRGTPGTGAEIPLQPLERPPWSRNFPAACDEDHTRFVLKGCSLQRVHTGAGETMGREELVRAGHNPSVPQPLHHLWEETGEVGMKD